MVGFRHEWNPAGTRFGVWANLDPQDLFQFIVPPPADGQHLVDRWVQLQLVTGRAARPQLVDAIQIHDVGSMNAEERQRRQPGFDFFQPPGVPVDLFPRRPNGRLRPRSVRSGPSQAI